MKAERRHELQQNTLARTLQNLPIAVRVYADKILLGVVIIMAIIVLIRWRVNAAHERVAGAAEALASARSSIGQLSRLPPFGPAQQLAEYRNNLRAEAENALRTVSTDASADDTKLRSDALLSKADLYWTLASLPDLPGAATQPSLKFSESRQDLLKQAEDAYQQVIQTYGNQPRMKAAALFGLAAIAEDRHDWQAAVDFYNQIKQSDAEEMYKSLADERLKLIPEMQQPKLFGSLTTKPAALTPLVMTPATQATQSSPTQPTIAVPSARQATTQPSR